LLHKLKLLRHTIPQENILCNQASCFVRSLCMHKPHSLAALLLSLLLFVVCLLLQAFLSPSNLNIVMEYVPDGSLLSYIQDNRCVCEGGGAQLLGHHFVWHTVE
jgi:serine/threonine protein kinase